MSHDLSVLARFNTPTIANAIELFDLRPRNQGFLRPGFLCLRPEAAPVAGFASTCAVSSETPESYGKAEISDYWEHVESIPGPRIAVVQDLDPYPGTGCFWGEVNASIHTALGCVGTVTDGACRDLDEMRKVGFQALYRHAAVSHSYIHPVAFGQPLVIAGTVVRPGDLLQADQHGVLIVPVETLKDLEAAVEEVESRERPVIDYCLSGQATRAGLMEKFATHIRNAGKWR